MRSSSPLLVRLVSVAAVAFSVHGACSFPDPDTQTPGQGGNPGASSSSSTNAPTPSSSSSVSSSSSGGGASSSTHSVGGSSSSSEGGHGGADGGGASTSDGGGGSTSSEGGGGGTLVGVGGGVTDIACDNGCVPYPSLGNGGAGGAGDDDCDDDGDLNADDCQPCNPLVFHDDGDQNHDGIYYDEPFLPFEPEEEPSFDYDCSNAYEFEYTYSSDGCTGLTTSVCEDDPIFVSGDAPACGEMQPLQNCEVVSPLLSAPTCEAAGGTSSVAVRCH